MNKLLLYITFLILLIRPTISYLKIELSNNSMQRGTMNETDLFTSTTFEQTSTAINTKQSTSSISTNDHETTTEKTQSLPTSSSRTTPSIRRIFPPVKKLTSTTPTPTKVASKNNEPIEEIWINEKKKLNVKVFCYCDLLIDECDVNCCCDTDCTEKMLKIFDCHEKHEYLLDFYNQQGLPSCNQNEGWFCIFRDNSIKEKIIAFNMNLKNVKKYSWPNILHIPIDKTLKKFEYYKVDEPIQLYLIGTEELTYINIPFSFSNPYCHILEPIRHLNNIHQYCLMSLEKSQLVVKNLQEKLLKSQLMGIPNDINIITKYNKQTNYIKINLFNCPSDDGEISHKNYCQTIINSNETNEIYDYINEIEIQIYHNFTNLIECNVYFYSKTIENNINSNEIWQLINVEFKIYNKTASSPLSGPFGYKSGFPVIISKLISLNGTSDNIENRRILDYFHPNKSKLGIENHLYSTSSVNRNCKKDITETINFGEDVISYCYLPLADSDKLDSKTNYSVICNNIQSQIFEILLNVKNVSANLELFISEFGYPKDNLDNWKKIEFTNFEPVPVFGKYYHINESEYFTCTNLIIGGEFEFLTGRLTINNIHNQNIIEHATFEFYSRLRLHFRLDENIIFPVQLSVMFYDFITSVSSGIRSGIYYIVDLYKHLIIFSIVHVILH